MAASTYGMDQKLWTAGPQVAAMWDEGSLQVNRALVHREGLAGLEEKKKLAKELAGVKE